MFANSNDYLSGRKPAVFPAGAEIVAVRGAVTLKTTDLAVNKAGAVVILPAGCVPVGVVYDTDDLDSGTGVVASVGFIKTDESDLDGTAWATGITTSQTGGSVQVSMSAAAMRIAPTDADRKVGVKFTTAADTAVAGDLGLTLLYRAA